MDNQGRKIVVCDNGTGVRDIFQLKKKKTTKLKKINKFFFLFTKSLSNAGSRAATFPSTYFRPWWADPYSDRAPESTTSKSK